MPDLYKRGDTAKDAWRKTRPIVLNQLASIQNAVNEWDGKLGNTQQYTWGDFGSLSHLHDRLEELQRFLCISEPDTNVT